MLTSRTSLENVEVEADFYGLVELKREVRKIVEAEEARVEEEKRRAEWTVALDFELTRRLEEISKSVEDATRRMVEIIMRVEGITVEVKDTAVNVQINFQFSHGPPLGILLTPHLLQAEARYASRPHSPRDGPG